MLPFFRRPPLIGISIGSKQLTCSLIETNNNKTQFILKGFTHIPLDSFEYKNLTAFNITALKKHIAQFIKEQRIKYPYAVISFSGPGFMEKVINLATGVPTVEHLNTASKNIVWDYQPIGYTRTTGKTHYYICGIPRENLLQHQLLAHMSDINCIQIIPQRIALLKALRFIFPDAWQTTTINNHASLQNFIDYYTDQCAIDSVLKGTSPATINKQMYLESIGNHLSGVSVYERY